MQGNRGQLAFPASNPKPANAASNDSGGALPLPVPSSEKNDLDIFMDLNVFADSYWVILSNDEKSEISPGMSIARLVLLLRYRRQQLHAPQSSAFLVCSSETYFPYNSFGSCARRSIQQMSSHHESSTNSHVAAQPEQSETEKEGRPQCTGRRGMASRSANGRSCTFAAILH